MSDDRTSNQHLSQLAPEFDEAGKSAMREKAARQLPEHDAFGHMSDEWVADRARMLMRGDLWHEAICTASRDRIMRLSLRVTELQQDAARDASARVALLAENTHYKRERDHWRQQAQLWHDNANQYLAWYSEVRQSRADEPGARNVAPIARVRMVNDMAVTTTIYAPGLPDGEHDLFPVPLNPAGEMRPAHEREPPHCSNCSCPPYDADAIRAATPPSDALRPLLATFQASHGVTPTEHWILNRFVSWVDEGRASVTKESGDLCEAHGIRQTVCLKCEDTRAATETSPAQGERND